MNPLEVNTLRALLATFRGSVSEGIDISVNIPVKGQPSLKARKCKDAFVRSLTIREHRAKQKKTVKLM